MRAFWMAWGQAVLLLAVGTLAAIWIFGVSGDWSLVPRVLARIVGIALMVCALIAAFRSGFLGTMALKQVLAENLAIVIAMELDDLRRAAEHRALSGEGATLSTAALEIPAFFGERDEIRKLLGKATEHTLEEIYVSLQSYNAAAKAGAPAELQGKATLIQEQVMRASLLLNQFLPSGRLA
jgi:hypothetical protein